MSYMACMEDLLLQKGCLKANATFGLCGFLKDLIYELILFVFMHFSCVGLVFLCVGLVFGVLDLYFGALDLYWVSVL